MYKLYPHNQKVYDMVLSYFEEAHKVAVIQATGTGKGVLAGAFVNSAFKGKRILILVPNRDIKINYQKSIGVLEGKNIKIETYPFMLSIYKNNKLCFYDLAMNTDFLIVDEFHRLGAEKWGQTVKEFIDSIVRHEGYVLGLTATPIRYNDTSILDNAYLDEEERKKLRRARNMADEIFGGNIIQGVTLEEAVYCGILPSFKYVLGSYGYEETIKEGFERLDELKELYGVSNQSIRKIERDLKEIVDKFGNENDNLKKLIQSEIRNLGSFQKWIVFCRNSEELKEVDSKLSYWFDKPINKYKLGFKIDLNALNLYSVYSEENNKENNLNLEAFYNANKGLNIMTCINKLNEGAHVSNITGIIMLRSTLSPIIYLQQIGRALSAGNKNNPIIFDFMGNIENMQKINRGEDEYVNSIRKSSEKLRRYNAGESFSGFLSDSERNYYLKDKKIEPKIVIKDNNVVSLSRLFGDIQDILHTHSSLTWSDLELAILDKYFKIGGANAVYQVLRRKSLGGRTIEAIEAKAKSRGLVYEGKCGKVPINKDNTLVWTPEEDKIILLGFESFKGRTNEEICFILHKDYLFNRKPEQIYNRYQHIKNGRGAREKEYARNGLRWTDADLYMLKKNYELNLPLKVIANELERSPEAILSKAQEIGLYRVERQFTKKEGNWTQDEKDYIMINRGHISVNEMSNVLGRSVSSINKEITRLENEKYYERRLTQHHNSSVNSRNWTELEEKILDKYWDASWTDLCYVLSTKTPKQIKSKILSDCKKWGIKNPFKDDEHFKQVS